MKSSLGKLRKIAMNKGESKENWDHHISVHTDGLTQAAKDMKEMRTCYDTLLSAAAAMANSAFEFSESLLEMGSCLLDRTVVPDDGKSGGTLSLLGSVQLELRKLVDIYRSHIVMTITNPSESLLSELRKVEEMKLQCDEKRGMFEHMMGQHRERGKSRHGKGESYTSQQLQAICEEYDDAARLCVFRVESLKQGQCQSLLTQAARHHTAQMSFFRKGLQSLEAVEPHVKIVAESLHIDYDLCELNDGEVVDVERNSVEANDLGELSFDYRLQNQELDNTFTLRNSMEVVVPNLQTARTKDVEALPNFGKNPGEPILGQLHRAGSHSAPLNVEKFDLSERNKETRTSLQKFNTHVLPTPDDAKGSRSTTNMPLSSTTVYGKSSKNLWQSSPLDAEKHKKFSEDPTINTHGSSKSLIAVEEHIDKHFLPLPLPLTEGASVPQFDAQSGYDIQKTKRLAFSGPLASEPSSNKLHLFTSGPNSSTEPPPLNSGLLSRVTSGPQPPPSLNVPQNAAAPLLSSPKISELHELPRPPDSLVSNPFRSAVALGHSAPLVSKNREVSPTYRNRFLSSKQGSTLPRPQLSVSKSFSVRSSSQVAIPLHAGKVLENMKELALPLTSISQPNKNSLNFGQM